MKLTKKKAKELSILKWEWIVKRGHKFKFIGNLYDTLVKEIPELETLNGNCGYCEYFKEQYGGGCIACPLNYNNMKCVHPKHPYDIWYSSLTKANAQAVLDLIKKS